MRSSPILALHLCVFFLVAGPLEARAARVASVFGGRVPCVEQGGVQFCAGTIATRVESWDGVPLDVSLTLPAASADRPRNDGADPDVFQLHPNGWHLANGHVAKLELLGQSVPYGRASNDSFTVTVQHLELRLAVLETPDGAIIAAPAGHVLPAPEGRAATQRCRLAASQGSGLGGCATLGVAQPRGRR